MMAAELVNSATSEKLSEMDWMKNIEICELVARDQRQAKDVIKAIKKRMGNKNSNTQLFAVMLLEMLMNNSGENVHKQVIDTGLLPLLVKIVKKKSDMPVREKIFLLLDATQTSLGGASGKFPQYYTAYYDLTSAGVKFTPRPPSVLPTPVVESLHTSSEADKNCSPGRERDHRKSEGDVKKIVPESSIIQKAGNALEVLRDVLDAVDGPNYEAAKDEFTLDLVEQCSFQKQRVMHLAITSRDEKVIARAINLNEQLEKVLSRHDALLSGRTTSVPNFNVLEEAEEEEVEQLLRRIRKGKACVRPEDDKRNIEQVMALHGSPFPGERLHRPLIRPLSVDLSHESRTPPPPPPPPPQSHSPSLAVVIPPPPAKYVERERFFQEKEHKGDGAALAGHVRGLSLHSRNGSSSNSGSTDSI